MNGRGIGMGLRQLRDAAAWRPSRAQLLLDQVIDRNRNRRSGLNDAEHLQAAIEWLERAQDATGNGGVAGRYRLRSGWTSAYPETTGYIIPTFLALAEKTGDARFRERASRAVEFLLPLQLGGGGFPGGEILRNRHEPSFFNTAQILAGLIAWHRATGDNRAIDAANRAAGWLLSFQEEDGAFRRYLYQGIVSTYGAHASCWIAELGDYTGDRRYLDAARRHVDWVLTHRDSSTGWIDLAGFTAEDHRLRRAVTHTIAYTLWGVLVTASKTGHSDGVAAVEQASVAIARRLELTGSLPGILDDRWRPGAAFSCLTGNAQMALIWFALFDRTGDARLLNAALKAIDLVKQAQPMRNSDPGIRGGIPGSYPVWGDYIRMALPNWAVKFFIDAVLQKESALQSMDFRPRDAWEVPPDVPVRLPKTRAPQGVRSPRVVVLATPSSRKVLHMLRAWDWGFRPAAVVLLARPAQPRLERLRQRLVDDGFGSLLQRRSTRGGRPSEITVTPDVRTCCREMGIHTIDVQTLDGAPTLEQIRGLEPDLFVFAGGAILRAPLLAIPRLGTLNAHMGLLPFYRGMNVAEWACLQGNAVGCSVHLIDAGIDTGDILCAQSIELADVRDIRTLRARVDDAQLRLLGEVLQYVVATGELPPRRPQRFDEGRQFFRMHPELLQILEQRLGSARARNLASGESAGLRVGA